MPRRAAPCLAGAALGVALLALTWFLAFHVEFFRHADQSAFAGFTSLEYRAHVSTVANFIAKLCDPTPYVYLAAIPVLVALVRGRPGLALAIAAILVGANMTTELLKPMLAHARFGDVFGAGTEELPASWPSGHATASMSLALTSVLAAPPRWRPAVAALGTGFALAVSYSFLALGWHYPSDVVGGFLVAAVWTLLGAAALFAAQDWWARRRVGDAGRVAEGLARRHVGLPLRAALTPPVAVLVGGLVVVALAAVARPHSVVAFMRSHEATTIGVPALGALAITIATGVLVALRSQ
jgi:membrane-associated phospholipid phosphatase